MRSSTRRESYNVWEKQRLETRLAPFTGTWVTAEPSQSEAAEEASVWPDACSGPRGGAVLVSSDLMPPFSLVETSGGPTLRSENVSATRTDARRLSYYNGFLGDVLSPQERAASAQLASPPQPHRDDATPGRRVSSAARSQRRPSTTTRANTTPLNTFSVVDDAVTLLGASRCGLTTTTTTATNLLTGTSATRRHSSSSSASVVDPLNSKGMDTSEARPRKSIFDAQLAAAMVSTAQRMVANSPTSRRASSSIPKLPRRSSVASSASASQARPRLVSTSSNQLSPALHDSRVAGTPMDTASVNSSVTKRIAFSPYAFNSAGAEVKETVGWGTQSPPDPPLLSGAAAGSRASLVLPRVSTSGGGGAAISCAPPTNSPQLSHKQLTEAFYGRYKGGVMAKDAYLFFLATQAEEKHKHYRAKQHKMERRVQERVAAQSEGARLASSRSGGSDTISGASAAAENGSPLLACPSAAFSAMGLPTASEGAPSVMASSQNHMGDALRARLRSMSLQSNLPHYGATYPHLSATAPAAVTSEGESKARRFSTTSRSATSDTLSARQAESYGASSSGYYQFCCIQDPTQEADLLRSGVPSSSLANAKKSAHPQPQGQRLDDQGEQGPAPPSTHLQELLLRSQAVFGAKQARV